MLTGEFKIDKEYIRLQIPNNLRTTWVFERVVDIIYSAISSGGNSSGNQIEQLYNDVEYYTTDFTKLSYDMKLARLNDNGYSYLIDVFGSDDDTLNNLASFLALIKAFRGRYEGFELILSTLGFKYEFISWEATKPKSEIFTAKVKITLSSEQQQLATTLLKKLQEVARNYLAPLVTIEYTVIEDLLDGVEYGFNNYFSSGYEGTRYYPTYEISRSL